MSRYPTLGTHSNRSRIAIRGKPRIAKLALRTVSCIGKVNHQRREIDIFGIFAITSFGKVLKISAVFKVMKKVKRAGTLPPFPLWGGSAYPLKRTLFLDTWVRSQRALWLLTRWDTCNHICPVIGHNWQSRILFPLTQAPKLSLLPLGMNTLNLALLHNVMLYYW